jgi:hypothetical protein
VSCGLLLLDLLEVKIQCDGGSRARDLVYQLVPGGCCSRDASQVPLSQSEGQMCT